MSDAQAANRLVHVLLDELVMAPEFSGRLRSLSTVRLQKMRRAVDEEFARRMQPHEDLRDGFAIAQGKVGRT